MNYELAKSLKEAGFPQEGNGKYVGYIGNLKDEDMKSGGVFGLAQEDFAYLPTLSELIEACGEINLVLWKFENKWFAGNLGEKTGSYSEFYIDSYPDPSEEGSTPEEAVANLFLTLHNFSN